MHSSTAAGDLLHRGSRRPTLTSPWLLLLLLPHTPYRRGRLTLRFREAALAVAPWWGVPRELCIKVDVRCTLAFPGRDLADLADILTYEMPRLQSLTFTAFERSCEDSPVPTTCAMGLDFFPREMRGKPTSPRPTVEWLCRPAGLRFCPWRDPFFRDSRAGKTWAVSYERHRRGLDVPPGEPESSETEVRRVVLVRQAPPPAGRAPRGAARSLGTWALPPLAEGGVLCRAAATIRAILRSSERPAASGFVLAGAAVGCAMLWCRGQRG